MELEPANLGKLTIRLVYEGDRASLSIMASNPRTLDMLSQKASEIAAILEEKTGQETIIYTQPAQQGSEQYDEQQNQNRSKEQGEPEEQKNLSHNSFGWDLCEKRKGSEELWQIRLIRSAEQVIRMRRHIIRLHPMTKTP